MSADDVLLTMSWFETAMPFGAALGDSEHTTWSAFASVFGWRREGDKDGPGFVPARLTLEADGRHVRRLKTNVVARTAVALDIETNKKTGDCPPPLREAMNRVRGLGLAAVGYTSHNYRPGDERYRLIFPLTAEIAPELPAPEIMAQALDLDGVLDRSKTGASSFFYLPSCPYDCLDRHLTIMAVGGAIDAEWIVFASERLREARQAEADRIAVAAHAEAAARRNAKIATGFDPDDGLIEKLRCRFDLDSVLRDHGYSKAGTKYRHPNSQSGSYGADIKVFGGIERVFSHNANDPLHADNLPAWCDGVTAVDAFDVVTILDFGGDRTRALRELAERFNLTQAAERRALAGLLFRMIRRQATQEEIETAAYAEGERSGLSRDDVCRVARWVASQSISAREAA